MSRPRNNLGLGILIGAISSLVLAFGGLVVAFAQERAPASPAVERRAPALRDWASADGKYRTAATFAALVDDQVRLDKLAGGTVHVPLEKLSVGDRDYVKELVRLDPRAKVIIGKVVAIADGDTLTVLDEDKQQHKIRLDGIDTPETGQAFGTVAKQALGNKVFGRFPRTEWRDYDRYSRKLGHVYLGDRHINLEMVAEGYAWHYKQYSSDPKLAAAELDARQRRLGLWRDESPMAPWEFRRRPQERKTVAQPRAPPAKEPPAVAPQPREEEITVYVTRTGEKYHRDGCRYLAKSKIPMSLIEAKRRFWPCSVCRPP